MTTLPKTSDLLSASALAKEFSISNTTVALWLEDAKLAASITMPYGRGFMRLYEPSPARDAIRARMPKPEPTVGPIEQSSAVATLKAMGYTYHGAELWKPPVGEKSASVVLDVLEERVEALTEVVKAVQEQNRALFAYLRDHVGEPVGQLVSELSGVKP